jgi:hypothetical protein
MKQRQKHWLMAELRSFLAAENGCASLREFRRMRGYLVSFSTSFCKSELVVKSFKVCYA